MWLLCLELGHCPCDRNLCEWTSGSGSCALAMAHRSDKLHGQHEQPRPRCDARRGSLAHARGIKQRCRTSALITIVSFRFGVAFIFIYVQHVPHPVKAKAVRLLHLLSQRAVLARWVKMCFLVHAYKNIFLDSDELDRLDLLFSDCASRTQASWSC